MGKHEASLRKKKNVCGVEPIHTLQNILETNQYQKQIYFLNGQLIFPKGFINRPTNIHIESLSSVTKRDFI